MIRIFISFFFLALVTASASARAEAYDLADSVLGDVTAKGIGAETLDLTDNTLNFALSGLTRDNIGIDVAGNAEVLQQALTNTPTVQNIGSLQLQDQAQQNLRALVNVNAVNSMVQVLLNLNISVDSQVGSILQGNLVPILPRP